jgi:hypothetical protein
MCWCMTNLFILPANSPVSLFLRSAPLQTLAMPTLPVSLTPAEHQNNQITHKIFFKNRFVSKQLLEPCGTA